MLSMLIIVILIGLIPASIAKAKGQSFFLWWFLGAAMFIVALPLAIIMKKDRVAIEEREIRGGMKKCPFCAELVKGDAVKCKHCGSNLPVAEIVLPSVSEAEKDDFAKAKKFIALGERSLLVGVLNSGLGVNVSDEFGKTLLDYAVDSGNKEIIQILKNRKAIRGNAAARQAA